MGLFFLVMIIAISRRIVIEIVVNTTMADFVGGFNDVVDIVGDFVDFAVSRIDSLESFLHFGFEPMIEWFPE